MNFLLCAIAKCENKYILEWVQWHLRLGFNKIVIYDNNDPEGERISDAIDLAGVEIVDWRGRKQASCETQVAAYNDCYKKHLDVDWIFFLDIDEFLEFKEDISLKSFFMNVWTKNANVIKFHWKCYSDSGYIDEQNGLVTETYKELCTDRNTNLNTKSAYRAGLENLKILNVHYCNDVGKIYYQSGSVCKSPCSTTDNYINYDNGWVRHYVTKSLEEFVKIKFARRNPGTSKTRLNSSFYFKYNKRTPEKEQKLKDLIMLCDNNVKVTPDNKPKEQPQNTNCWERMEPTKKGVYDLQNKKSDQQNILINSGERYPFGVSICISAWKTAEYIEECLDSVANQTWFKDHDNWEILLGIDACEETLAKVKEIMHKYKNLRVMIMNENVGTYVTCNTIMSKARYEWLMRFDSDDVMYENMVETIMKEKGSAEFITPRCYEEPNKSGDIRWGEGQVCIKHKIFDEYGGFQNWRCAADTELRVRTQKYIKQVNTKNAVFYRRKHENRLTKNDETGLMSEYRLEKKNYIKNSSPVISKIEKITTTYKSITPEIIVSFTTWKKRHDCAAIMLDWFKQQTIKPDKIICWLSSDEYDGENIPQSLQKFVNEKYIEVRWIKENTYCHKRYEVFREHKDDYVFLIDDDIYYEPNYIQLMYDAAKEHPQNIICYTGYKIEYEKDRIILNLKENPSIKNTILSGLSCYPPNVFPIEYFANLDIRDKISPKCDDSFLRALALKNNIQIFCIYDRKQKSFRKISQYQNVGIWEENKVVTNGVMVCTQIFKNLIHAFGLEQQSRVFWKNIIL